MNLKIKFVSITRNVTTKRFNYIVSGGDFLNERTRRYCFPREIKVKVTRKGSLNRRGIFWGKRLLPHRKLYQKSSKKKEMNIYESNVTSRYM